MTSGYSAICCHVHFSPSNNCLFKKNYKPSEQIHHVLYYHPAKTTRLTHTRARQNRTGILKCGCEDIGVKWDKTLNVHLCSSCSLRGRWSDYLSMLYESLCFSGFGMNRSNKTIETICSPSFQGKSTFSFEKRFWRESERLCPWCWTAPRCSCHRWTNICPDIVFFCGHLSPSRAW